MKVVAVTEKEIATRATAAFAAGELPDVLNHTVQHLLPFAEAGMLDSAATEVVEELGVDTFASGPVNLAKSDGEIVSVPTDGWMQLVVYRSDLFQEHGLNPPRTVGPLANRERRLAYVMLLPTFFIVLFPLLANFWISFKAVELGDLRAARPMFNEQLKPRPKVAGRDTVLRYRIRHSSKKEALEALVFYDDLPDGLVITEVPASCALDASRRTGVF